MFNVFSVFLTRFSEHYSRRLPIAPSKPANPQKTIATLSLGGWEWKAGPYFPWNSFIAFSTILPQRDNFVALKTALLSKPDCDWLWWTERLQATMLSLNFSTYEGKLNIDDSWWYDTFRECQAKIVQEKNVSCQAVFETLISFN